MRFLLLGVVLALILIYFWPSKKTSEYFGDLSISDLALTEEFSTSREKARSIYDWFARNPNPSYTQYKADMKSDSNFRSNVVEYEDVLKLMQDRNLTIESVEKAIQ